MVVKEQYHIRPEMMVLYNPWQRTEGYALVSTVSLRQEHNLYYQPYRPVVTH